MASRKGIHISRHHVVSINASSYYMYFQICTLNSKKVKGRTESRYFMLFLKLNNHTTRCFNFGLLRRIHPNGCKFELNF